MTKIEINKSQQGKNRFVLLMGKKPRRFHISRQELFQLMDTGIAALSVSVQGDRHHG
jgi:hypothetical protein